MGSGCLVEGSRFQKFGVGPQGFAFPVLLGFLRIASAITQKALFRKLSANLLGGLQGLDICYVTLHPLWCVVPQTIRGHAVTLIEDENALNLSGVGH